MEFREVLRQPVNYLFLLFTIVFVLLGFFVRVFRQYNTLLITIAWMFACFYAWTSSDSGYTTIWFAGFITWLVWLWEASRHSTENIQDKDTCPWVTGSDALFWTISVPLFAVFIGLWARTFIGTENGFGESGADEWAAFVGIVTLGYAIWLTLWRMSCLMPFIQGSRSGGMDYSPIDGN